MSWIQVIHIILLVGTFGSGLFFVAAYLKVSEKNISYGLFESIKENKDKKYSPEEVEYIENFKRAQKILSIFGTLEALFLLLTFI